MPEDTTKDAKTCEIREYADIEVHGIRTKVGDAGDASSTRPMVFVRAVSDWSKATRYGDFEVMEDPRGSGLWLGRHRTYAFVADGYNASEALAATQDAFEFGRKHFEASGRSLPEWACGAR
jgi:hypothetical protein